ncbi:MAG: nucleoside hydrolase [Devosia sp. 67-54]|uniref:nucleoside hydrolase n=1 Tax=unclassified Devosia TaxID=196773 RepID=UPI00095CD733|nr:MULTISPECIES: nucleoside hydrolase [unclassified Devosia]MBN9307378.1 nucleoside hydrolase [Devosia sp.]OJX19712.1 MAG: nucleoside hydrolase [Devosia sp. 67-54]
MTRPFIFDSDGGVDDAQALILLVANGRAPDIITTVFGNVGRDQATTNLLAVAAHLGLDVPVHRGADRPLTQPIIDATDVHGNDGLGGAARPKTQAEPASDDAVGVLIRTFRDAAARGGKADILMIGPLTNLALALRLAPDITAGIGTLTIMGGTVYGRGNTTPAAEFNIYADPEAAHIVLTAGVDTIVVPWEACVAHYMDGARVDALFDRTPPSAIRDFSAALVNHYRGVRRKRQAPDNMLYVDPLAAAVVVDPAIVTKSVTASSSVELAPGLTRGMTLVDPSGRLGTPRITFVEQVDLAKVDAFYARSVAYVPTKKT